MAATRPNRYGIAPVSLYAAFPSRIAPMGFLIGRGRNARETYPETPRASASSGGVWTLYTPAFDNSAHDASLGDGDLAGTYIVEGKTCRIQLALTWGSTSTSGTAPVFVPMPPGVTLDPSRMAVSAALGDPITPVVATGLLNGSPIAVSADFIFDSGEYITTAPLSTLQAGSVVFLSAEFPIV